MAVIPLTFKTLQDELVSMRFGENRRENCKRWLNHSYGRVWSLADWPFKKVIGAAQTIPTGAQPTVPSDFGRALGLLRNDGVPLNYVSPGEYEDRYRYGILQSAYGTPQSFTVVNGSLLVGPLASSAQTYYMSYERSVCYFDSLGTVTVGQMSADSDYPLWPSEHHYLLVYGAMAAGLREINDPTFGPLDQAYEESLTDMMNDLLPPDAPEPFQYGRDDL